MVDSLDAEQSTFAGGEQGKFGLALENRPKVGETISKKITALAAANSYAV
jgi:hypothetical protein